MPIDASIFGNSSNFDARYIKDYDELARLTEHIKGVGLKVVLTSGSFDFYHLGHALYIEKAKEYGDVLIVGVDSDEKVRERKGLNRPLYPQDERLRILVCQRSVDIVTLKELNSTKWLLIKIVRPDILIATQETYSSEEIDELESEFCGKVVVLEPQAKTSTSSRLRDLNMELATDIGDRLAERIPGLVQEVIDEAVGRHDKPKENS
ncbi:adenylyltransferase/cytidyltransferase family protein [Candidatus Saccharibacteria bacterium]|nr:adenylyltransferase/cytidyltransferase family protein [Candidatus Saccharibacteria bacterium]